MGQIKTIGSFDKDGNNTPAKIDAAKTQTTGRELKIQNLMSHIGMAVDNLKNIHKSEGGWKGLYKKIVGSDTFQTGLATAVAYSVGAVAEGVSGSTLGALGAFALEAGDLISKHWGEPAGSFDVGEWVAIDNGAIRLKKAVQRTMAWGMGNWFHDFPQREDEEMETERLVSFGFVIEPSTFESDMIKVFNFETGENQDVRRNMVRALPGPRQMVLNTNENLAAIKAIVLDKDEVVHRLACDIPCDPGEEVIYKGKAYNIVTCDGTTARIGDSAWHFDVKMSELSRGRVAHTNSWNYKSFNKGLTSGFNSSSKSSFFKGQWVWIKPRAIILKVYPESLKELGVIRLINGTIGDGYYAVDGVRFQSHLTQVVPVHAERQEWLNRHKDFFKFRSFAVTGEASVTTYSLGRDHLHICIGLGRLSGVLVSETEGSAVNEVYANTPGETPGRVYGEGEDPLAWLGSSPQPQPNMEARDMVDAAISVANQYGISPGQTMGNVAAGNPEPRLVKKAISGNSMAFLGFLAVGVVGFLVLAR